MSHETSSGGAASTQTERAGRPAIAVEAPVKVPESGPCRLNLTEPERRFLETPLMSLTPRERDVAFAVCEGGDHERVAASLCIAVPTLRTHLMRIHQKLGAENKSDVVRFVSARLVEAYRTQDPKLLGESKAMGASALESKRSA